MTRMHVCMYTCMYASVVVVHLADIKFGDLTTNTD